MIVYTKVEMDGTPVNTRDGFPWINAKSVQECALMALHRAGRNGLRGRVRCLAWTDTMKAEGHVHAIISDLVDNVPEPRPRDDQQNYASSQVGTPPHA